MKTQKQVIISIGREFGSAGHEIAERIAKRYGLSLYDHNLLREVADSHNVNPEELEIFEAQQISLPYSERNEQFSGRQCSYDAVQFSSGKG